MSRIFAAITRQPFTGERRREADLHRKLSLAFALFLIAGLLFAAVSSRGSTAWNLGLILVSLSTVVGALHFLYRILRGATHPQLQWREYADANKRSKAKTNEIDKFIAEQRMKAVK